MSLPLTLALFSGLPGCGKTTLARCTAAHFRLPLFTKDRVQQFLLGRGLAPRSSVDGYLLLLDQAGEQLSLGVGAVLDAVFPLPGFRLTAREIAAQYGARLRVVYCFCSDRELWKQRMLSRVQYVPNWTPVGWEEVERLEPQFQPWAPGEALGIDAAVSLENNWGLVRNWIQEDLS